MRVGVFGGSFNPPHIGHLIVAEVVRDECDLDRVIWIPASRPPHKLEDDVLPSHHRIAMIRAAVLDNPMFEVSDTELQRGGVSYTIDTLIAIRRSLHPRDEVMLIIGSDSYEEFGSWRQPDKICDVADLLVYPRGSRQIKIDRRFPAVLIDAPVIPISSTDVRNRIRDGHTVKYIVTDPVREYIATHGLYGTQGSHRDS